MELEKKKLKSKRVAWNKGKTFNRVEFKCEICNKQFNRTKGSLKFRNARFCSAQCRNDYFAKMPKYKKCVICGKEIKDRMNGTRVYCSSDCYWIKLREIYSDVRIKDDYEFKVIDGKKVRVHVLVMEKHIGRKMKKGEVIHHINFNNLDNRIENLEILTQSEHIKKHFSKFKWGKI